AGHGADAAGHGGQPAGYVGHVGGYVAGQARVGAGDADVDHGRAGLDHVGGEQAGAPGGYHHDVGGPGVRGDVLGPGMAQRHRGVLGAPGQQQAEGTAHGDAAADDGDVGPRDGHAEAAQQFHDAARGT